MIEKPPLPQPPFLVGDRVTIVVLGVSLRALVHRLEHDGRAWTGVYVIDANGAGLIRRAPHEVVRGWGVLPMDVPPPRR